MNDPMRKRALRLLQELHQHGGTETLDSLPYASELYAEGNRPEGSFRAVVNHLESARAVEEATESPYGSMNATYHRIIPTGMRMLREAGQLP